MTCSNFLRIAVLSTAVFALSACAEVPYSPAKQDFSDQIYWGSGLIDTGTGEPFNPYTPVDIGGTTSGGGTTGGQTDGDVNGVYLGSYLIDITDITTMQTCSCASASLTLAIQNNMISIGQGAACVTTCTSQITLNFTGSVIEGGIASGSVDITESVSGAVNTLSSSWSGVIIGGTASGSIIAPNVPGTGGTYDLTGSFTASKQ